MSFRQEPFLYENAWAHVAVVNGTEYIDEGLLGSTGFNPGEFRLVGRALRYFYEYFRTEWNDDGDGGLSGTASVAGWSEEELWEELPLVVDAFLFTVSPEED